MKQEKLSQRTDDFDYALPKSAIAQKPAMPRDVARLLVDNGPDREVEHAQINQLASYIRPGDLVVVNETSVIPARLPLKKSTGGAVEVFLLEPIDGGWAALLKPSKRAKAGTELRSERDEALRVVVGEELPGGQRKVELLHGQTEILDPSQCNLLKSAGESPLPPYITAKDGQDSERYQTVYARTPGSVAAPTAGLHLTDDLINKIQSAGANFARIDLVVGIDTFRPVLVANPADHVMHSERYSVSEITWQACQDAQRVIAIGTTTVRALESAARGALAGRTELFLRRGSKFEIVDMMMTNFHMPRSTLLMMIDAFIGERWKDLYEDALASGYRFLSFGDAMLLNRALR